MSIRTLKNFINGKDVDSSGQNIVDVISPATGKTIAYVKLSTSSDVDQAVEAGLAAFDHWRDLTVNQRAKIMLKFYNLVETHCDELSRIIVSENGKNIIEGMADVAKGNETVEWACGLPQLLAGRLLEVSRGIDCCEKRTPMYVQILYNIIDKTDLNIFSLEALSLQLFRSIFHSWFQCGLYPSLSYVVMRLF